MEHNSHKEPAEFNRIFFNREIKFTTIGTGSPGGKASGLAFIEEIISKNFTPSQFPDIHVSIPTMTVIKTDIFDSFMKSNNLYETAFSDLPDDRIAHAFQKSELPSEILGDLRSLINQVKTPLAIRSSSMLEDAMYEPFAGIYATKMIPNNQIDSDTRFRKLVEAIKFVYSSTYFKEAKDYMKATRHNIKDEKMAVIIQEVVGQRYEDRFYPVISGVARSYNFYSTGYSKPEDGVVNLALGLGKTIVDGGKVWYYSPSSPKIGPPCTTENLLKQTQTEFWTVNMGKPPVYDPLTEAEYLSLCPLSEAEKDGTLRYVASTYNGQSDRIYPGISYQGARVLNFAPVLSLEDVRLNDVIRHLLTISENSTGTEVEIEFAVSIDRDKTAHLGFLQVRPMVVSHEKIEISQSDLKNDSILLASENVLGNGITDNIKDIVYVNPHNFNAKDTSLIIKEIEKINNKLHSSKTPYLLIGFGRWGSSDPWLGIPATWGQICGAKVIVESTLPEMNVDLSQGSHFFHNITGFQVSYFSLHHGGKYKINWNWLEKQNIEEETDFVKHIKLKEPLLIKIDGRNATGVIIYNKEREENL